MPLEVFDHTPLKVQPSMIASNCSINDVRQLHEKSWSMLDGNVETSTDELPGPLKSL